jgi:hypothetical protein
MREQLEFGIVYGYLAAQRFDQVPGFLDRNGRIRDAVHNVGWGSESAQLTGWRGRAERSNELLAEGVDERVSRFG